MWQRDSWVNKIEHLDSERKYLPILRKVKTVFKEALSGEEKLIEGIDIILKNFPSDDYLDDFIVLWDMTAYNRQSYFKKIFPLISEFNSKFVADNR